MSDFKVGDTLHFLFTTRQFSDGVPTVLSGTPVLGAFEDAVAAPITAGVTVTVDVNSVVGLNRANIVATGANGFEAGKSYSIAITTGTVGGTSVVGEVVAFFSLGRAPALQPTTLGNTLDVAVTGEAGVDLGNVLGVLGNANVGWVDGSNRVDVGQWLGGTIPVQGVTGVPEVNITHQVDGLVPTPTTTGVPDVNVERWLDVLVTLGAGAPDVNIQSTDNIALSTQQKADVLAEINTALDTVISELGVAAPAITPTLRTGLMLLYMALRNKLDVQTSGTDALEVHNDAGTQITSKLLTDAGGDYSEAKMT